MNNFIIHYENNELVIVKEDIQKPKKGRNLHTKNQQQIIPFNRPGIHKLDQ